MRELQAQGKVVAKSVTASTTHPPFAAADIGIAMDGGTDVALETSYAAILHGRVVNIANIVGLSKATMTNIGQNITLALRHQGAMIILVQVHVLAGPVSERQHDDDDQQQRPADPK